MSRCVLVLCFQPRRAWLLTRTGRRSTRGPRSPASRSSRSRKRSSRPSTSPAPSARASHTPLACPRVRSRSVYLLYWIIIQLVWLLTIMMLYFNVFPTDNISVTSTKVCCIRVLSQGKYTHKLEDKWKVSVNIIFTHIKQ